MDDEQTIKSKFNEIVKNTIKEDDWLNSFDNLWSEKLYRQAYGLFAEYQEKYDIELSSEHIKADKEFYWLFVN